MYILILSYTGGQEHDFCAEALHAYFTAQGTVCDTVNVLDFVSGRASEHITALNMRMNRHRAGLLRSGHRFAEEHSAPLLHWPVIERLLASGGERLAFYVAQGGYEAVICTHPFAAIVLREAVRQSKLNTTTALVVTDYCCAPGIKDTGLDLYFLPHSSLTVEFSGAGIPADRLAVTGIPLRRAFQSQVPMDRAKRCRGIFPESRHVVLCCGASGCGPVEELTAALWDKSAPGTEITVVCGTNRPLLEGLQQQYEHCGHIHIQGYVEDMADLMDSADLLLTRPGGLIATEAAVKGLPLLFVDAADRREECNRDFFVASGGALACAEPREAAELTLRLLQQPERLEEMRVALRALVPENADEAVLSLLSERHCAPEAPALPTAERMSAPQISSSLRHSILKMPKACYTASGIVINGRRIKTMVFTTDLAIIRNCDADAVFAVYPFTPQQAISDAIIKASYIPVFCGVGGGTTKGLRTISLAKDVESQGAMGVVLNAPISNWNLTAVARAVDIPVIITVVSEETDIAGRLAAGAAILNVAGGPKTPLIVRKIRERFPDTPIIASGGNTEENVRLTIEAGANAITFTPPSTQELFKEMMNRYREE